MFAYPGSIQCVWLKSTLLLFLIRSWVSLMFSPFYWNTIKLFWMYHFSWLLIYPFLYCCTRFQVDSIQSLLQSPSILVCVGREPFHPLLLDSFQKKNSEDKLPKLILKPRSTTCNEDQGFKKNGMLINIYCISKLFSGQKSEMGYSWYY